MWKNLIKIVLIITVTGKCDADGFGGWLKRLDTTRDYGQAWDVIRPWFVYVNSTRELEEKSKSSWYPGVDFDRWEELEGYSEGIWALFYQDQAPEYGLPPPSITFRAVHSLNYHNLYITFYLYGESYITVTSTARRGWKTTVIENECDRDCGLNFTTAHIVLNEVPNSPGKAYAKFALHTTKPGDFILIDKIEADVIPPTTPKVNPHLHEACRCVPCDESLNADSDQDGTLPWRISESFRYFSDAEEIKRSLPEVLPEDFAYGNFSSRRGIWVIYEDNETLSEDPAFLFGENRTQIYEKVQITGYLHGDSEFLVYTNDDNLDGEPIRLTNHVPGQSWQTYIVALNGTSQFRIEVNLTDEGNFAFVDQIIITRRDCPSIPGVKPENCPCIQMSRVTDKPGKVDKVIRFSPGSVHEFPEGAAANIMAAKEKTVESSDSVRLSPCGFLWLLLLYKINFDAI